MRFDRESWSEAAARELAGAMPEDGEIIADAVQAGRAQLYRVENRGYLVLAVERRGRGPELVIVAGAGRGLHEVIPELRAMARRAGIATMRTHVKRRGLVRMYRRHGFEPEETVLRASV